MNTLSRALTAQILTDSQTYLNIRRRWSELMRSERKHELTAAHHLLYLALLGKDWRKGFTCVSNSRKLENGAFYAWGLHRTLAWFHMPSCDAGLIAPFEGLVTPAMLERLRQFVPVRSLFKYEPEQFADGKFPFEAYHVPDSVQEAEEQARHA